MERMPSYARDRIIDEPANSFADVISQITATDLVIATRFHNLVLAFMCGAPVLSISFHDKCTSLMEMIGASDYCLRLGDLTAQRLIDRLCHLEANVNNVRSLVDARIREFQVALDRQYEILFPETGTAPSKSRRSDRGQTSFVRARSIESTNPIA
jgi:polysaccharide pyruvyl transferase WcaK-like protein